MIRSLQTLAMATMLLLGGCGYHLVGHGEGSAVPADVETLSVAGSGDASEAVAMLRQHLAGERYQLVNAGAAPDKMHHATLLVSISGLVYTPSAYDANGVATQYRMIYSGSLRLERGGKTIWQSGALSQRGDVYVSGGPASIDAARDRLLEDLRKAWVGDALGRFRSGF